ncbi:phytanoyl-CoA dioxygenase family protein [Allosphingosinicella deserti]|uniref:phytanoyl-CoA dioxygenase family protein n=1 Tax=Allosphingosinicella deserti TaxID=2116704 RepID=UPI001304D7D1|nr:phytanoyl-CoA dioxygenase family protein [Sphingomonas deserti]
MAVPTFIDPDLEARFAAEGVVVLRLLDADEATALGRELLATLPRPLPVNGRSIFASTVDDDVERQQRLAAFAAAVLEPALAHHLTGGRTCETGIVAKPAGGGVLPFHHHPPFVDRPYDRAITCWCPLMDTSPQTGGLRIIPGSSHILPFIRVPGAHNYFGGFKEALDKYAVDLTVEAGEAILFETTMLHGSGPNHGPADRIAVTALLTSAESRNALILEKDEDWLEIFETGDDPAFADYVRTWTVPDHWRSIGLLPNRNRIIDEREFARLLARGARATFANDEGGGSEPGGTKAGQGS